MKLTHNMSATKPYKTMGMASRAYQTPQRQVNHNFVSDKRQDYIKPQVYTSRTSAKMCTYENNLVCSQVNDRISQFSAGGGYYQGKSTELYASSKGYSGSNLYKKECSLDREEVNWGELFRKMKTQIMEQVNVIIKEHRAQTAKSLKQAIFKVDEGIKKEFIIQFSRQFLPISYLDDSEKQHQDMQNRFQILQSCVTQANQRQAMIEQQQRYLLTQIKNIRDAIRNTQYRIQSNQKTIRMNEENIKANKQELTQKINEMLTAESSVFNQIMKLKLEMKIINQTQNSTVQRVKQLELRPQKQIFYTDAVSQADKNNTSSFLRVPQATNNQNRTSLQMDKISQTIPPSKSLSLTFSLDSISDLASPKMKEPLLASIKSLKHIKSTKYILDQSNNLMDDTGNYILDDTGQQVKLTQQQILILRESNIVKYVEL